MLAEITPLPSRQNNLIQLIQYISGIPLSPGLINRILFYITGAAYTYINTFSL